MEANRTFHAMGTDITIVVGGDDTLAEYAQKRIVELENMWSRFIASSEISRMNADTGRWHEVSLETAELVRCMVNSYVTSGGAYDPTVLGDVLNAGYIESFPFTSTPSHDNYNLEHGAHRIRVKGNKVFLPLNVGIDPGGIGKGLAGDMVTDELLARGATYAIADLGGDVVVKASASHSTSFDIAIRDERGNECDRVVLYSGAVATSTISKRAWRNSSGELVHHIIDPATGQPVDNDVHRASAISHCGWQAEVLAKTMVVMGSSLGVEFAESIHAATALWTHDSEVCSSRWKDFSLKVSTS